jgi:hypothetical protein
MNMDKLKYSLLIFLFIFNGYNSIAQLPFPDGVKATTSFINEIKKNYDDENAYPFDLNTVSVFVKIPVRVHIVKNTEGVPGANLTQIYSCVNNTNGFFKNIGIQFFIDSVNYVDDYNYGYITNDKNTIELLTKFAIKNRINLFLVDSVEKNGIRSYGYTYFPDISDSNFIFLDKKYIAGNALSTLMGHFMGLLSTHENLGGSELASEKNCSTSGDFICDTYADPDLYNQVDSVCRYTGSSRDDSGRYYVPSVANMMSNSNDHCKCIFSPLQYRRMYYYYLKYRQKLKY